MSSDSEEKTAFLELVAFVDATASLNVRRAALEYVTGVSVTLDGSASEFFKRYDFAIGHALCKLCEATASDRTQTMAALTNFTSGSAEAADFVLENSRCTEIAFTACTTDVVYASVAARLLANVSRHFPDRVCQRLQKLKPGFLASLINEVKASAEADPLKARLVGFVVVNLTTLSAVRELLVKEHSVQLTVLYEILAKSPSADLREVVADVLRNLSFDDDVLTPVAATSEATVFRRVFACRRACAVRSSSSTVCKQVAEVYCRATARGAINLDSMGPFALPCHLVAGTVSQPTPPTCCVISLARRTGKSKR
ncbi:unnamed protein product [Caenorhabditis auriculariae]|uniref:Protein HGH1 homolog n=1 Tax=Caenorhabditis auriculariae TaxID=2777116 RepID=A0A8S1GYW1_9PELO|nr:unnamed protein product [Caenorhabditis auriculariae]